ncbi:MAG: hypothetical protein RLZZ127_2211 [Planctomycetota bacterium]|jgi:hypothetical protein
MRYDRVRIRAAWAATCAGDAAAAWAAACAGGCALARDPVDGWIGRTPGDLPALALAAVRPHLDPDRPAAVSASASKPDLDRLPDFRPVDWWRRSGSAALAGLGLGAGACVPVAAACSTGLYGLLAVADRIEHGLAAQGAALAWDRPLAPLLRAAYRNLGVACGPVRPGLFPAADGFAPAEGAGALVLAADGPWRLAAGIRLGDAGHETAFADPRTLATALEALAAAVPVPDLIVLHATGTAQGDAYEAAVLGASPWAGVRRVACKPAIGHTLGASGLVELAAALCDPAARRIWKLGMGFGGHLACVAVVRD